MIHQGSNTHQFWLNIGQFCFDINYQPILKVLCNPHVLTDDEVAESGSEENMEWVELRAG